MDAIKATLHSYKSLATRKQLQITLEVPQEYADTALKMLGVADPSGTQWFGLTRLNAAAVPERAEPAAPVVKAEKPWSPSQIAHLKCGDPEFQAWIQKTYPREWMMTPHTATAFGSANMVLKEILGVQSKSEFDRYPEKAAAWDRLLASFEHRNQVRG